MKDRIWRLGHAEFDESCRELRIGGQLRPVEAKPLLLFEALLSAAGEVVTKKDLLAAVWPAVTVVEQSLTTAVAKLRTALGEEGRAIVEAVHGVGYRIGLPIDLRAAPERPRLAFTLQPGDPVPLRPQWCLERALGQGRANDVWLARHQKTGERRVFKFADTTERLETLKREAALSRILHNALGDRSDLVRISEWNFDTRPYFIESPFGGDSLPEWASARGGMAAVPLSQRVALVAKVAHTVAAAHDVGVLHRDIKPSNVLITAEGDNLSTRLVDFGSGRLTEAAHLDAVTIIGLGLTAAAAYEGERLSGTLRYMAPEVVRGGPPTIAADVFALGVLLYQAIVGDLDRPLGAGWEVDVADDLLREDVSDAASIDATRRLPSAQLLAERLDTLELRRSERERLSRLRQESEYLTRQVERARVRRPWLALGFASLALGLTATGVFATRAMHARNEAQRQTEITRQVNSFLTDDLLGQGNPFDSGHANETLMEAATKAEPRIAARFASEPIIAASIYASLARAFAGRSAFPESRAAYDQAVNAYDRAEGMNSADATILRLQQVSMEVVSGQADSIEKAKQLIRNSKLASETFGPRGKEVDGWRLAAEGMLQLLGGDVDTAKRDFAEAADIADSMPDRFVEFTRFSLRQQEAFACIRLRQWNEADNLLSALVVQQTRLHGDDHPNTLLVKQTQAVSLMSRGNSEEAVKVIDSIMSDLNSVYGPLHRLTLQAYATRAQAEGQIERYDPAIRDDSIVYQASLTKQGAHALYTFATLADIATSECRDNRVDVGLTHALKALQDAKDTLGETNAVTQSISGGVVAFCLIMSKQYTQAERHLEHYDLKGTSDWTADPDNAASVALMEAAIAANTGDHTRAEQLLRLPLSAFSRPSSDRFFHRWALSLSQSLSNPASAK